MDRLREMQALIEALGGKTVVLAAVGRGEEALRAAYRKRVFPSAWFGDFAALGRGDVSIPLALFGTAEAEAWPDLMVAVVDSAGASDPEERAA